jgi:stage V sporulation protein B
MASQSNQSPSVPNSKSNKTSFAEGVAWNFASLAFLAVAGIGLNIIIGRWYGPESLGTFNVAFAVFIFLSQIASFGMQFSILKTVSTIADTKSDNLTSSVYGGLLTCGVIAGLVTAFAFAATPLLARLFPRVPDLGAAWLLVAPGLLPFALNKYLLATLNGLQLMRAFSVLQALRYILILLLLAAMIAFKAPGYALASVLAISEFVLLVFLLHRVSVAVPWPVSRSEVLRQGRKHALFGLKVFPAGMVAELNTRVDVLMLGALLNDRAAGVYTVAALIYEAALQAVVVLRNNINPRIAQDIVGGHRDKILQESRWIGLGLTSIMMVGAVVAYLGFPYVAGLVFSSKDFEAAQGPLFWLMLALPLAAAPLCYSLILSQANHPLWQSAVMIITLGVNIAANAILIPLYGIEGAAMAMGLSSIVMGLLMVLLARRLLGIRLFL